MRRLASLLLICVAPWAHALEFGALSPDEVAVYFAPVDRPGEVLAHRADVAVNPASTMKLVTAWAALDTLGPSYRWRTRLLAERAPDAQGRLSGALYWQGGGDPGYASADLAVLLDSLRACGVRELAGPLLLDDRQLPRIASAEGFGGDAEEQFTVAPAAHLVDFKAAWIKLFADANGARAAFDPPLGGVQLDNRLTASNSNEACGDVRNRITQRWQSPVLQLTGSLPPSCDGASFYANLLDTEQFALAAFAGRWQAAGGSGPNKVAQGSAPAGALLLAEQSSGPLAARLGPMLRYSNNTMARTLYLNLGKTPQDAAQAVRASLRRAGLAAPELVLENGSGLSRRERISARNLGEMLRYAARQPYGAELIASLPEGGGEGTLKRRFTDYAAALRLKTGTLDGVRALAGYWFAPDGQRYVLVAVLNSPRAEGMVPQLDALVRRVLQSRYTGSLAP